MVERIGKWIAQNRNAAAVLLLTFLSFLFLARVLFPPGGEVLGGYDMRGLFHVLSSAVSEVVRGGDLPLWNPYLFNGFPLMADPQTATFYPPNWLTIILPSNVGLSWYLLFHILSAGLGMYSFLRATGARWYPALLSSLVFAFGGVLAGRLWAGHGIVLAVFSWTPWMLLALHWCATSDRIWPAIIAGLPFSLAILSGHLPSFIYVLMIWSAFVLYLMAAGPSRRIIIFRQSLIMALVGIGLAAIQLVPTLQLSLLSERVDLADYEFATRFSFPPAHLATLVVPEFFGEPLRIGYWSVPTFEELTYYAGILSLLLLVIGLMRPDKLTWFYVSLMVFGILLAMGSYGFLHRLLYNILPPMRVMRAPARAAFLFFFAASALAGHVFSQWEARPVDEQQRWLAPGLKALVGILLAIGVAAIAATSAVFISVHPTETSGRLWHQMGGIAFALFVALLSGGLLWFLLVRRIESLAGRRILKIALLVVVLADLWTFSYKFVRTEAVGPDQLWLDAKEIIGETESGVLPWGLSIFTQNGGMQSELRSVFGYNSLALRNHLALASSIPDPRSSAYDVLGTEFVISEAALDQYKEGESGLVLLGESDSVKVYRRPSALPFARLLYQYEVIDADERAVSRVHEPDFDPETTVIVDRDPECTIGPSPDVLGTAEIHENGHGYWNVKTNSETAGILVVAESAYPGWRVKVDGESASPLMAYSAVKAVCVPAGEHVVEWSMGANTFLAGLGITVSTVALVFFALQRNRKAIKTGQDQTDSA